MLKLFEGNDIKEVKQGSTPAWPFFWKLELQKPYSKAGDIIVIHKCTDGG